MSDAGMLFNILGVNREVSSDMMCLPMAEKVDSTL